MKRLVIDLDNTLCLCPPVEGADAVARYRDATPMPGMIERLRQYRAEGFEITIFTARNMRTFAGDVAKITAETLPIVLEWLERHQVPFDEVIVGKPWCGDLGFYVDDRAVRPSEFLAKSPAEIAALLKAETVG